MRLLVPFMCLVAAESLDDIRRATLARFNIDFSLPPFAGDASNYSATIDPTTKFGVWEGWGTSLCWWGAAFGDRDDLADLFFTLNTTTTLEGKTLPGLGLNIARYNAGGSSYAPDSTGEEMVVSKNMIASRQIFGFWQDWDSQDPASTSWNWTADALQISMLQKAQARGASHLELFSNSPMWWMCDNHNPSGNDDGRKDNLETWNQQQHAVYLASVAAQFMAEPIGVTFTSVEAFNEPISDWWSSTGTQEGCHFERETQAAVLPLLRAELDARGLHSLPVSCSDENTYDEALVTWESFSDDSQSLVGQVNTHGYQQARGRRDLLFDAVQSKGKVLWNSEYGEGDATGLSLASNLNLDFKWLHNTAWVYWQVLDGGGWGLLQSDEDANANDATAVSATTRHAVSGASGASSSSSSASVGAVNNKYFALAQYTRHFRPGMTIFATSASDTVAAYDTNSQTLAVVSVVYSQARWVTIDLSAFVAVVGVTGGSFNKGGGLEGLPVSRWVTNTGADATQGDLYVLYSDLSVGPNGTFSVYFEANTLMTFEVSGVSI